MCKIWIPTGLTARVPDAGEGSGGPIWASPHSARASGVAETLIRQVHDTTGGWPPQPGGIERAMPLVPDQVVDALAAAGTPAECQRRVQEYAVLSSTLALWPLGVVG